MIRRIRHKGLKRLYAEDDTSGVNQDHVDRLKDILARLDIATNSRDMALPGLHLHPLTGSRRGTWAVSVSGNWRITFKFDGEDITDVDYEDYH